MLNVKTYNDILEQLYQYDDISSLSAKELANISYTSPSTISRFVKKMGYSNFNEMKVKLVQEKEQATCADVNFSEKWQTMFNVSFSNLTQDDIALLKRLIDKKIYVYCDREYELLTRHFVDTLLINDYDCALTTTISSSQVEEEAVVISIGYLPTDLYYEQFSYYQIGFDSELNNKLGPNVQNISLKTPQSLNMMFTKRSYHTATLQLLISMMSEFLN